MVGNVAAIALSARHRDTARREERQSGWDASAAAVQQEEAVVTPIGADKLVTDIRSSERGEGPTIHGGAQAPSTARTRA